MSDRFNPVFLIVFWLGLAGLFFAIQPTPVHPGGDAVVSPSNTSNATHSPPENFTVQNGSHPPAGWTYPVGVEFWRPANGSWITTASVTVNESEEFHPDLTEGQEYAVVVTDATGEQRKIGTYVYQGHGAEIVIENCCVDDFPEYP